jgi:hypothetical protein
VNQKEILKLISESQVLDCLTSTQLAEVEQIIKSRGFKPYVGLLLGAKQAQLVALSQQQLGSSELSCRASVIQGTIRGIDLALQSFVDLFPEAGDGEN